jgi:hypothetical protein
MKIIEKVNQKIKEGRTFFSFEFFPPRTEEVGWAAWHVLLPCLQLAFRPWRSIKIQTDE